MEGITQWLKKLLKGAQIYNWRNTYSVSVKTMEDAWKKGNSGIAPKKLHSNITQEQRRLYRSWKSSNPNKTMGFEDMATIEIDALVSAGIPESYATGWVITSLDELKNLGIKKIIYIPWNGVNP